MKMAEGLKNWEYFYSCIFFDFFLLHFASKITFVGFVIENILFFIRKKIIFVYDSCSIDQKPYIQLAIGTHVDSL